MACGGWDFDRSHIYKCSYCQLKKIKKMINKNPIGILIRFVAKHKKSTFFFLYFYFYLKGKELGERLLLYPEGCEALKPWERKEKNK